MLTMFTCLKRNRSIVVGVSGGPDSMALLDWLVKKQYQPIVVHINYHCRNSANRDQLFVEKYCKQHQLRCYIFDCPVLGQGNFQHQARDYRYQKYQEVYKQHNANALYLGHHYDDNIETIVFQLLTKRKPQRLGLVKTSCYQDMMIKRPFLNKTKDELIDYCHKQHIEYGIDESNQLLKYTRNQIRYALHDLTQTQKYQLICYQRIYNHLQRKQEQMIKKMCQGDRLLRQDFLAQSQSVQYKMLRYFLMKQGVHVYHMSQNYLNLLCEYIDKHTQSLYQLQDVWLVLSPTHIWIEPIDQTSIHYQINKYGPYEAPQFKLSLAGNKAQAMTVSQADYPLVVRYFKSGDKIEMPYGTKKVSRYLIDKKIHPLDRKTWLVIENSAKRIIFVEGLGADYDHQSHYPNLYLVKNKKNTDN